MGLKMENLHMPSATSGRENGPVEEHQKPLVELISDKDKIEEELKVLSSVLDSHGVNMNTGLTTLDGFPRDDIDIAQIRTTRARIIHLRNDYKAIMSKIEKGLHAYHATILENSAETPTAPNTATPITAINSSSPAPSSINVPEAAFAKVNSVINGSPADEAGLMAGDEVIRFGPVNFMNHAKLSKVAETVQQHQGRVVIVKVSRKDGTTGAVDTYDLRLTPRLSWGGRGLLGCHLLPL